MSTLRLRDEDWNEPSTTAKRAPPGAAAIAGTAVHAAFESWKIESDFDTEMQRLSLGIDTLVDAAAHSQCIDDERVLEDARSRARAVFRQFVGGPLRARLASIAPHVVARELALLADTEETDGFASTASGAIDLVYRDAERGVLVIVDFKTDSVSNASEASATAAKHEAQMQEYRTALTRALALEKPPRAELWFLAAGEIIVVD
jgi:ATP-dependent exoDNAse (exonuclease V) beta subunit